MPAHINEIFNSIQGEGPYAACARFLSGLKNASCTVLIATHHKHVKFHAHAGLRHMQEVENSSLRKHRFIGKRLQILSGNCGHPQQNMSA